MFIDGLNGITGMVSANRSLKYTFIVFWIGFIDTRFYRQPADNGIQDEEPDGTVSCPYYRDDEGAFEATSWIHFPLLSLPTHQIDLMMSSVRRKTIVR